MEYQSIEKLNSANEWWMVYFGSKKDKKSMRDTGFGFPSKEAAVNALDMARWIKKHKVKI